MLDRLLGARLGRGARLHGQARPRVGPRPLDATPCRRGRDRGRPARPRDRRPRRHPRRRRDLRRRLGPLVHRAPDARPAAGGRGDPHRPTGPRVDAARAVLPPTIAACRRARPGPGLAVRPGAGPPAGGRRGAARGPSAWRSSGTSSGSRPGPRPAGSSARSARRASGSSATSAGPGRPRRAEIRDDAAESGDPTESDPRRSVAHVLAPRLRDATGHRGRRGPPAASARRGSAPWRRRPTRSKRSARGWRRSAASSTRTSRAWSRAPRRSPTGSTTSATTRGRASAAALAIGFVVVPEAAEDGQAGRGRAGSRRPDPAGGAGGPGRGAGRPSPKKKGRGLIGAGLGLLAPIAMRAVQNYATHFVSNWIAQPAGPDRRT